MFSSIKSILFPHLCRICESYLDDSCILCNDCLVGVEFGAKISRNTAYLFSSQLSFLQDRSFESKRLLEDFCIIRLSRLFWKFGTIHTCASLYYLKKGLRKMITKDHGRALFIVPREKDAKLLEKPRKADYILLV